MGYEDKSIQFRRIMEENILGKMVTNELQANVDRFRDLVESNYKNEI